ncbi:MAG: hypothetical protein HN352_05425 [Bacteroidetes bacterium]|jgi:hypothetical protein|nr:hypothetical protein [Bacteroidota bacterium]MBT3751374.1 hypothetical protein [Bacteroidota bacterium]MBT4400160.1 hypothetical protein [Bacteroidota bacterium]MBT4408783.1 hypothetical protein [Bacteroidota bacterium]MBT5426453.1 hypothetical protein [Bacteroidota bacterium]
MYLLGIFGSLEILITIGAVLLIVIPTIIRKMRGNNDYTEKLDQLERLERMYRDGSISERDFKRQKRKILKKR